MPVPEGSLLDNFFVSRALNEPKKRLFNAAAGALGLPTGGNSEDASRAIVERAAQSLGIPEDSTLGNAGKALGVAGMEVFGDPMNYIPGEQIAGMAEKGAAKAAESFPQLRRMFQVGEKLFPAANTAEALKIKRALEEAGQVPPDRALRDLNR